MRRQLRRQYRNAQIYFSRTKQRVNEKGEAQISVENPEVLLNGLNMLRDELGLSSSKFSESVNLTQYILSKFSIPLENKKNETNYGNIIYFNRIKN